MRPGWLLAGCCLAAASRFIEPSAWLFYPPEAALFGASWTTARMLSSVWGFVMVVLLIGGGLLGDLYGRRRLLLIGLAITLVADLLLLVVGSDLGHILMRVVTHLGGALVLPLALAPLYLFYKGKDRVRAFAWYALATTLASVLATFQASFMIAKFGWRGAYFAGIALALAALIILYFVLPESHLRVQRNPTALFYAGWSLFVLAIVYGLIEIGLVREWAVPAAIIAIFAGMLGISLMMWWDVQTPGKLWDDRTLRLRDLAVLVAIGVAVQFVLMGVFAPTFRYFNVVKEFGLLARVLAISPLLVGMFAGLRMTGRLWKTESVRRVLALGFMVCALCIAALAFRPGIMPYFVQIVPLAIFGFSILSTKTVWANAFYQTVVDDYIGLNAGINGAALQLGGVLGVVVGGLMVTQFGYQAFSTRLAPYFSAERIDEMYRIVSRAPSQATAELALPTLNNTIWHQYVASYAQAYGRTLLVIAAFALLSALVVLIGLRKSMKYTAQAPVVDVAASVFEQPALLTDELAEVNILTEKRRSNGS